MPTSSPTWRNLSRHLRHRARRRPSRHQSACRARFAISINCCADVVAGTSAFRRAYGSADVGADERADIPAACGADYHGLTSVPTVTPTSLPVHTAVPTAAPASVPVSSPASVPTPSPTSVPTGLPTSVTHWCGPADRLRPRNQSDCGADLGGDELADVCADAHVSVVTSSPRSVPTRAPTSAPTSVRRSVPAIGCCSDGSGQFGADLAASVRTHRRVDGGFRRACLRLCRLAYRLLCRLACRRSCRRARRRRAGVRGDERTDRGSGTSAYCGANVAADGSACRRTHGGAGVRATIRACPHPC